MNVYKLLSGETYRNLISPFFPPGGMNNYDMGGGGYGDGMGSSGGMMGNNYTAF